MKQFNVNVTPEFERDLKRYMSLRKLSTKSDAVRMALSEIVTILSAKSRPVDLRSLLGAGLKAPLNSKPKFKSDDDLW
jgi:hypothetical protein